VRANARGLSRPCVTEIDVQPLPQTRPREPFKLSDLTFLNPIAVLVAIKNAGDLPYTVINGFLSVESGIPIATHSIETCGGNLRPWDH
jgi:hypothetical protein